jgi:hypothetical protein
MQSPFEFDMEEAAAVAGIDNVVLGDADCLLEAGNQAGGSQAGGSQDEEYMPSSGEVTPTKTTVQAFVGTDGTIGATASVVNGTDNASQDHHATR